MDFSYKTSQVGDIWLFFSVIDGAQTLTHLNTSRPVLPAISAQAYFCSPERVLEPGSKGTDIGMQLTLATV